MAFLINSGRGSKLGLALLAAAISLGTVTAVARDDDHRDRGRDRDVHRDWHGGYYPAPPVVYATPDYYAPPVVVAPGLGLSINIR